MAEEQVEQGAGSSSSRRMQLIIVAVVVLGAAVAAVAVFQFVLRPRLHGEAAPDSQPLSRYFVTFDDLQVTGLPDTRDELPPILQVTITMACDSAATAQAIENNLPYFRGMLVELYSSKTRTQLSEAFEKDMIRAEARRKANDLLERITPGRGGNVTTVMHEKYLLVDQ